MSTNSASNTVESTAFALSAEFDPLRNDAIESTDTAVLLGLAVTPVTPSPDLRNRVMDRIASMPQLPREVAGVRAAMPGLEQPTVLY